MEESVLVLLNVLFASTFFRLSFLFFYFFPFILDTLSLRVGYGGDWVLYFGWPVVFDG